MLRVLQISMGEVFGGIERLEIEWLNRINSKEIELDVLTPSSNSFGKYKSDIKKGNIYNLNTTRKTFKGRFLYDIRLFKFLKKNKYDIIHINSGAFFYSFRIVIIAKLCGVKKIIVHSHSTYKVNKFKRFFINILNPIYTKLTNYYISCTEESKQSLFTNFFIRKNKITILKNGIDVNKYKFDLGKREEYRNEYNLNGKMVYGHIGRFSIEKNHEYLIDTFKEISKKQKNSFLVLIGDGELLPNIKEKVNELGLESKVLFLGFRDNISDLLNMIDAIIFPSLHEGSPVSLIEAQANGIPVFCSDKVPVDSKILYNFIYFSLDLDPYELACKILKYNIDISRRHKLYKEVIKANFEIDNISKELVNIYLDLKK